MQDIDPGLDRPLGKLEEQKGQNLEIGEKEKKCGRE